METYFYNTVIGLGYTAHYAGTNASGPASASGSLLQGTDLPLGDLKAPESPQLLESRDILWVFVLSLGRTTAAGFLLLFFHMQAT